MLCADGTSSTLPILETTLNLNHNVYAPYDDAILPPIDFLKTRGFLFDQTEDIRDRSIDDYI
jgi:hypothetical protein